MSSPRSAIRIVWCGVERRRAESAFALHVEPQGDDFVVSPILGPGRLCESCWLLRRMATLDVVELGRGGETLPELKHAFRLRCAHAPAFHDLPQRVVLARTLRKRIRAVRLCEAGAFPPRLTIVGPGGAAREEAVLPFPDCVVCGRMSARGSPCSLDPVVGAIAGIVAQVREVGPVAGEPAFPYTTVTRLANTWLNPTRPYGHGASGKGETHEIATQTAIAESIERYAAGVVAPALTVAPARRLDEPFVEPMRLTGSEAQSAGYSPDAPAAWVRTRTLDKENAVYVPASAVYLRLPADAPRPITVPFSSNGLACAPNLTAAVERAFAEVVERHVFFSVWYGLRRYAKAYSMDDVDAVTAGAVAEFAEHGLTVRLLKLGVESGVHVAAASCWPQTSADLRPRYALGLGTGDCAELAARRAILEMAQVYRGLTWALRGQGLSDRARELAAGRVLIEEPYDHGLYYAASGSHSVPAPFGLGPGMAKPAPGAFSDALRRRALFVELTPLDIASATGWHVVRVVVPDAIPYHYGRDQLPLEFLSVSGRSLVDMPPHPLN